MIKLEHMKLSNSVYILAPVVWFTTKGDIPFSLHHISVSSNGLAQEYVNGVGRLGKIIIYNSRKKDQKKKP